MALFDWELVAFQALLEAVAAHAMESAVRDDCQAAMIAMTMNLA